MAYSFGTVTAEMAYKGHRIETTESPMQIVFVVDGDREEQMEAFRVYLYHPQYIDNSEDIKIKLVESLYNDLKKL